MSRRGSISKSKNGTWYFIVDIPAAGDRRRQVRRRGFPTRRAAQAALNEVLASLQTATFVKRDRITLADYLADWMADLPASGRAPATVSSYRHNLRLHVVPYVGALRLQDVSPTDLDRLYRRLRNEGRRNGKGLLSNRTVRYVHTVLAAALKDAVNKGLLVRNPAEGSSPPSAKSARPPEMAWWRPSELRAFLTFVKDHELATLFRLAGSTGMRRGEVVGLLWNDLDLGVERINVRRQTTSTDYVVRSGKPKSERGVRLITLDPGTAQMLSALDSNRQGHVFVDAGGHPLHPESVSRIFTRLVRRAGLPSIRFHDLRHSHVVHLIERGVDPLTISRRLGHASVAFTLDRYGHLFDRAGETAAQAIGDLLAMPSPTTDEDDPVTE